jgi:hypothetical protein
MAKQRETAQISVEAIAEQCIAVRLRMLSRAVTRIYNRALRPYGLTPVTLPPTSRAHRCPTGEGLGKGRMGKQGGQDL